MTCKNCGLEINMTSTSYWVHTRTGLVLCYPGSSESCAEPR